MSESADDAFPDDPADYATVAVLECVACGETGRLYSTGEPRERQWWDCEACGRSDTEHRIVMSTSDGVTPER